MSLIYEHLDLRGRWAVFTHESGHRVEVTNSSDVLILSYITDAPLGEVLVEINNRCATDYGIGQYSPDIVRVPYLTDECKQALLEGNAKALVYENPLGHTKSVSIAYDKLTKRETIDDITAYNMWYVIKVLKLGGVTNNELAKLFNFTPQYMSIMFGKPSFFPREFVPFMRTSAKRKGNG